MPLKTGTLTVKDLQSPEAATLSVIDVNVERAAEAIRADLATHNALMNTALGDLAETTEDRQRLSGSSASGEMVPADEFTRAPTQKVEAGQTVGFPLEGFQYAIGWTQEFLEERGSAQKIATQALAAQTAHARKVMAEMKRAIFVPTNYTFRDYLVTPQIDLAVKRFYNADGSAVPDGPNGETFDGTHQHYLANASLTAAALLSLVNTVAQHTTNAQVRVAINAADEAAVSALSGFKPYVDSRLVSGNTDGTARGTLSLANPGNRAIGIFGLAEVWVKPWAIANYAYAYDMNAPERPLVRRVKPGQTGDLRVIAENAAFPLIARYMKSQFGFGVWGRHAGAVLQFNNGTYSAPTING